MRNRGTYREDRGGRYQGHPTTSRGGGARTGGAYPDSRRTFYRKEEEQEGRLSPENKARRIERQGNNRQPPCDAYPPRHAQNDERPYGRNRNPEFPGRKYETQGPPPHTAYRNDRAEGRGRGHQRGSYQEGGGDSRPVYGGGRRDEGYSTRGQYPPREGGRGRGRGQNAAIVPVGTRIALRSNISTVFVDEAKTVYRHRVDITYHDPAKLTPRLRRLILLRTLEEAGYRGHFPYDGTNLMVSETPINLHITFEGPPIGLRDDGEISITPVAGALLLSEVNDPAKRKKNADLVNVFQMILDEASRYRSPFVSGGAFAHEGDKWIMPWGDRFRNVPVTLNVCHKNALGMVCIDGRPQLAVTTDVVGRLRLQDTTVDRLADAMNIRLELSSGRGDNARKLVDLLRGLKVVTRHLGYPRPIHIRDIKDESADTKTLDVDGRIMTLEQYYHRQYNIRLKRPHLRVLEDQKGGLYPPEILHLESQAWSNKLKARWQAEVPKLMAMSSQKREKYLRNALEEAFGGNPILDYFGIHVNQETVTPVSQMLRSPVVRYANTTVSVADGAWNMANVQLLKPARKGRCGFVNLTTEYRKSDVLRFYEALRSACRGYGLDLSELDESTYFDRPDWEDALKKLNRAKVDLVFVLISVESEDKYGNIKRFGDRLLPTQVIVAANTPLLGKNNRPEQHLGNLALKVNNKLGGTSHALSSATPGAKSPFECLMQGGITAILGADICHCGKVTVEGCQMAMPSYAALTVTVNAECSQFAYSIKAQSGGPDVMTHMAEQVAEVLNRRDRLRGKHQWPSQIIYLRDGFSDNSIDEIRAEAGYIKEAYRALGEPEPRILAIAVRKRQMTRFFVEEKFSWKDNVRPGVVVLDDLTMPCPYPNFYLVSHAGIKGTTIPTRYIVVHDDFQKSVAELRPLDKRTLSETYAEFCYQMCALFPRCTRTVSYPAPVYSAHCLAERAKKISEQLKERLFYYPDRRRRTKEAIHVILSEQLDEMIKRINVEFSKLSPQLAWH